MANNIFDRNQYYRIGSLPLSIAQIYMYGDRQRETSSPCTWIVDMVPVDPPSKEHESEARRGDRNHDPDRNVTTRRRVVVTHGSVETESRGNDGPTVTGIVRIIGNDRNSPRWTIVTEGNPHQRRQTGSRESTGNGGWWHKAVCRWQGLGSPETRGRTHRTEDDRTYRGSRSGNN